MPAVVSSGLGKFSRVTLISAMLVIAADQLSKSWARESLTAGTSAPLLPGILRFTLVTNTGGAFGIGRESAWLMFALASALTAAIAVWTMRRERAAHRRSPAERIGMGLLLGGAIGNLVDRVAAGRVTDFLEFAFVSLPVFNVADACIDTGIALIVVSMLTRGPADRSDHDG